MLHLITVTYENLIILILPGSISQFKPVLTQLISTAVNPVSKTASVIIGNFTKKEKKKKSSSWRESILNAPYSPQQVKNFVVSVIVNLVIPSRKKLEQARSIPVHHFF